MEDGTIWSSARTDSDETTQRARAKNALFGLLPKLEALLLSLMELLLSFLFAALYVFVGVAIASGTLWRRGGAGEGFVQGRRLSLDFNRVSTPRHTSIIENSRWDGLCAHTRRE